MIKSPYSLKNVLISKRKFSKINILRGYHTMFLYFLFYMQLSHLYIYYITILQIKCKKEYTKKGDSGGNFKI